MVYWRRFRPEEWDIGYDIDKLEAHGIAEQEAVEVIWNVFVVRRNKKEHGPDRYQLLGLTDAGRPLKLIVLVLGEREMRVITGWAL